jgi:hypothetical protein
MEDHGIDLGRRCRLGSATSIGARNELANPLGPRRVRTEEPPLHSFALANVARVIFRTSDARGGGHLRTWRPPVAWLTGAG